MGKIFVFMGASCSGKDSVFKKISANDQELKNIVLYTTRPKRINEVDGVTYNFITPEQLENIKKEGQIIESRDYHTIQGTWTYATCSSNIDLENYNYITINTIDGYLKLKDYYRGNVVPILIQCDPGIRLERAIKRELKQERPQYEEMCRRFLADSVDFGRQKISIANIDTIFYNNASIDNVVEEIEKFIQEEKEKQKKKVR